MERTPTAGQLLDLWEEGRFQTPAKRVFSLLALTAPAVPNKDLARYGIGRCNQELLGLRECIFGPSMTGAAQCPFCGQDIEMDFSVADLRAQAASDGGELHTIQFGQYEVCFRLPTCGDLVTLATKANGSVNAQKLVLLQSCVTEARCRGESIAASSLPEETAIAVSRHMADLDPPGDLQLSLTCPKCNRSWESPLDMVSYLWEEIHAWAVRMLREVHALAIAYGWREAEILALSPWRRQAYLEMIRQ